MLTASNKTSCLPCLLLPQKTHSLEIAISTFPKQKRATLKTYERTGTDVFLKLFKKAAEDYEFEQRISLTLEEFGNLVKEAEKIPESATQDSPLKPPPAKKQKFDQCSKDGGSNV